MTEEERKRYFGVLVEQLLYRNLQLIAESTKKNKRQLAANEIKQFYEEYKEYYKLKDISEVYNKLEEIKKNMKKIKENRER